VVTDFSFLGTVVSCWYMISFHNSYKLVSYIFRLMLLCEQILSNSTAEDHVLCAFGSWEFSPLAQNMVENFVSYSNIGEPSSSVSIVTGYRLGGWGSIPNGGGGFFLYLLHPAGSGAHPASYSGYRGSSPGGKFDWGVLLTTHPLSVLWVKKERGYTSSAPVCQDWHAMGNLYFFFLQ
jgi:hypothetical protein